MVGLDITAEEMIEALEASGTTEHGSIYRVHTRPVEPSTPWEPYIIEAVGYGAFVDCIQVNRDVLEAVARWLKDARKREVRDGRD